MSSSSSNNNAEEEKRAQYCRDKGIHHLFELLATRTLKEMPENIFQFLRDELTQIEEEEKRAHSYDPSQIRTKGDGGLMKITLAIFGLDNAGKTALLSAMGGNIDTNTTPTIGFSPTSFQTDKYEICIFDLGGGSNFRGIWPHYYHDCHGIIYVVDAADEARVAESAAVFGEIVNHKFMARKPVLVFANKHDAPTFNGELVKSRLQLGALGGPTKFLTSCAIREDANIDAGVEWLLTTVESNYGALAKRVQEDTAEVKEEKKRRLAEQQARVEAMRAQQQQQQ